MRVHTSSFAEKDTYRRRCRRRRRRIERRRGRGTRTVVVGKPERVPTPLFPFSSPSSPSCRSLFFCQPTSSRPRGESTEGYPSSMLGTALFRRPFGRPFACPLSLVSQGSLPPRPSRAPSRSRSPFLSAPPPVCMYVSNACDSEVTQKIFIDRESATLRSLPPGGFYRDSRASISIIEASAVTTAVSLRKFADVIKK